MTFSTSSSEFSFGTSASIRTTQGHVPFRQRPLRWWPFCFDQRFIEAARRFGAQDVRQHLQRSRVFMRPGRHMISHVNHADIANAPKHHRALPFLRRLLRISGRKLAFRDVEWGRNTSAPEPAPSAPRIFPPPPARRCPAGNTFCKTPADYPPAHARCRFDFPIVGLP